MPKFSLYTKLSRIQKLIAEFEQGNTPQARDVVLVLEPQQRAAMDAQKLQLSAAESQQKAQFDSAKLQLDAQQMQARMAADQQRQEAETQRKMAELQVRQAMNTQDNLTAMELAQLEVETGERIAVSTGTGINPQP